MRFEKFYDLLTQPNRFRSVKPVRNYEKGIQGPYQGNKINSKI